MLKAARTRALEKARLKGEELELDLVNYLLKELEEFLDQDAETFVNFLVRASKATPKNASAYAMELGLFSAADIIAEIEGDTDNLDRETDRRVLYRHRALEIATRIGHFGLRLALAIILA